MLVMLNNRYRVDRNGSGTGSIYEFDEAVQSGNTLKFRGQNTQIISEDNRTAYTRGGQSRVPVTIDVHTETQVSSIPMNSFVRCLFSLLHIVFVAE
jgi:hypothetical protein